MSNELAINYNNLRKATLADIEVGHSCVIIECNLPTKVKARFAEMGLVPDTEVAVIRIAPLGDPVVIRARGYELCLRKDTANSFTVKLISVK
ncbi:MAG: ferrous iron transport protein A [Clostridiales bacterium]|nr:ferrous iron transport protein A [Clostridiales bacterium]